MSERLNVAVNKRKILTSIAKNEPTGRSTTELVTDTKLHRSTVQRISVQLISTGWIKKKHKASKYHLTEKAYGDLNLVAGLLGNKVRSMLDPNVRFADLSKLKPTTGKLTDDKEMKLTDDEEMLFTFASKVGILVTYIMIQALRPKKVTVKINDLMSWSNHLDGRQKDEMANHFVNNALNLSEILWEFSKLPLISRGLPIWNPRQKSPDSHSESRDYQNLREYDPDDPNWSRYDFDEKNFQKLLKTYCNLFPRLFDKLQNLTIEINEEVEWIRKRVQMKIEHRRRSEKEDPHHLSCKGLVVPVLNDKEGRRVCMWCHREVKDYSNTAK